MKSLNITKKASKILNNLKNMSIVRYINTESDIIEKSSIFNPLEVHSDLRVMVNYLLL